MTTNYDFIIDYIYMDTLSTSSNDYARTKRHGSLSYSHNILYSYNMPIAIKLWHGGKRYLVATIGRGCSNTTSRHIYTLSNNMWRGYSVDRIIPVYNVCDIITDHVLELSGYKNDLRNWLERAYTDFQFCDAGLRQHLVDRMNSARNLAELDPEYEQIADAYQKRYDRVSTVELRNKIRAEVKKQQKEEKCRGDVAIAAAMLESEDVLFDFLAYEAQRKITDTRVSNLFSGITSNLIATLTGLHYGPGCYDQFDSMGKQLGYRIWFSLPTDGLLPDGYVLLRYVVDGGYGSNLVIKFQTLFDKYREDPAVMFELDTWDHVSDSSSYYKVDEGKAQVSKADENDYLFHLVEGSQLRFNRDIHVCGSVMQLLHHFVTTCRDKLGRIAYAQGEKNGRRRRSSAGQSEGD